jgi:hypothetical protein
MISKRNLKRIAIALGVSAIIIAVFSLLPPTGTLLILIAIITLISLVTPFVLFILTAVAFLIYIIGREW